MYVSQPRTDADLIEKAAKSCVVEIGPWAQAKMPFNRRRRLVECLRRWRERQVRETLSGSPLLYGGESRQKCQLELAVIRPAPTFNASATRACVTLLATLRWDSWASTRSPSAKEPNAPLSTAALTCATVALRLSLFGLRPSLFASACSDPEQEGSPAVAIRS